MLARNTSSYEGEAQPNRAPQLDSRCDEFSSILEVDNEQLTEANTARLRVLDNSRRRSRCALSLIKCLARYPHPLCNTAAIICMVAIVVMGFALLKCAQGHARNTRGELPAPQAVRLKLND
eukprot:scaffold946_cov415-Prasinococcus_capsulatus_cf.AAC.6